MIGAGAAEPAMASAADAFLDRIAVQDGQPFGAGDVLVVAAHPDDETIALGGQMSRLLGVRLAMVTDGAPIDMADALANGFQTRTDYAAARKQELLAAVGQAGISERDVIFLDITDQETARELASLTHRLMDCFRQYQTRVVLTHCYEGGHPDHDSAAFAVHAAAFLLARETRAPEIVEFPLYRERDGRMVLQDFASTPAVAAPEIALTLPPEALALKKGMMASHATQERLLGSFKSSDERFRKAPLYDFGTLPNGGAVLYDRFGWKLTGAEWLRHADEARKELELPRWF